MHINKEILILIQVKVFVVWLMSKCYASHVSV